MINSLTSLAFIIFCNSFIMGLLNEKCVASKIHCIIDHKD